MTSIARIAEEQIPAANLLLKTGSSGIKYTQLCGAADTPIGVSANTCLAGELVTIRPLEDAIFTLTAAGAIPAETKVELDAVGKVASASLGKIIGHSVTSAEDGQNLQVAVGVSEANEGSAVRVVRTITVTTNPYTTTISCDADTIIIESATDANLSLTALPTIQAGLYPGQQITLQAGIGAALSYFTLYSDVTTAGTKLRFEGPSNSLNVEKLPASAPKSVTFVWDGELWWQHVGKYATTTGVNILPAPWPPPDANGVQRLSDAVKDALVLELSPYFRHGC